MTPTATPPNDSGENMTENYSFDSVPLIPDQPVDLLEADYLGLMPWAKMIAGSVVGTRGPFTIGVHGEWGYGKTSLLKLTKALIDEPKNGHSDVVTVWFNAWQFEREDHPLFSLIAAIADEIEKKTSKNPKLKALSKIGASIRALTRGMKFTGEVGMPLVGKVGVEFDAEKALKAEELIGAQSNPLQGEMMYHSAFEMLEDTARGEDGAKIAVFIDDLDRCQPDKAVALLESIKLILSQPGFVFVLAVDPQPIEGFLQKRYREHFECKDGDWGKFYMEKIIQLPIIIPSHRTRFGEYVERLVKKMTSSVFRPAKQVKALIGVQDVIAVGAGTNPRTLVRLINNFLLDCSLWPLIERGGDKALEDYRDLTQDVAAALAFHRILQHVLGDLYVDLVRDQDFCSEILAGRMPENSVADLRRGFPLDETLALHPTESPLHGIAKRLLVRSDLVDALRTYGRRWLEDEALRVAVNEFAQAQRPTDAASTLPDPIRDAVREALGVAPDEPIPASRLCEVTELNLSSTQVTDADLQQLRPLAGLQKVYLGGTQVTDAGLQHLQGLTRLSILTLNRCAQITDAGLQHLKGVTSLGLLRIDGCRQVTDKGLEHLKGLPGLRGLWLDGCTQVTDEGLRHLRGLPLLQIGLDYTDVTDTGVEELKRAIPNLNVHRKGQG